MAVLGNNGAGKSTLITCVNRIRKPDSGEVRIDGRNVGNMGRRELARNMAYVAQKNEMREWRNFSCEIWMRCPAGNCRR